MKALSVEQSLLEGEFEVQKLFKFVTDHAVELKAYDMEKAIFSRLMQVGQAALKSYFALKGTGDVDPELEINGVTLSRAAGHYGRDYFSVFGENQSTPDLLSK